MEGGKVEGEVELPDEAVVKCSVWRIVSDFIRSSTGEEPYECEHFYLSDLLDDLAGALANQKLFGSHNRVDRKIHIYIYNQGQ